MENDNALVPGILFVLGLLFGAVASFAITNDHWRQEMVNKGFAEWHITSGTREVEFKWKEKQ